MTWLGSPYSYLTWFYQMPGLFAWWINQVISIKENWISILATVLFVSLILFALLNFNKDK